MTSTVERRVITPRILLEGFVGGDWLGAVDLSTLERVSDAYVTDDLRARADDIIWRVRCGECEVCCATASASCQSPWMLDCDPPPALS